MLKKAQNSTYIAKYNAANLPGFLLEDLCSSITKTFFLLCWAYDTVDLGRIQSMCVFTTFSIFSLMNWFSQQKATHSVESLIHQSWLCKNFSFSGPYNDDRNPHKKRDRKRVREGARDQKRGGTTGIHFQDLIKSRPHPIPPFFRRGTKFPCAYDLPLPPPPFSCFPTCSLSASCSTHTLITWNMCIRDTRCTDMMMIN